MRSSSDIGAVVIRSAAAAEIGEVRALFLEYARSLNFDLCFQGFEQELANLPGAYAEPSGRILLAAAAGAFAGVVALRPLGDGVCEMKRLYVRPAWRGRDVGGRLARAIVDEGRRLGYRAMRLDTHDSMQAAVALYRSLGFREIPRYYDNPLAEIRYFELDFSGGGG